MNILEVLMANKSYPSSFYIESDIDAANTYEALKSCIGADFTAEVELAGVKTAVWGKQLLGVSLTPSCAVRKEEEKRKEREAAMFASQTSQVPLGAGLCGAPNSRSILG